MIFNKEKLIHSLNYFEVKHYKIDLSSSSIKFLMATNHQITFPLEKGIEYCLNRYDPRMTENRLSKNDLEKFLSIVKMKRGEISFGFFDKVIIMLPLILIISSGYSYIGLDKYDSILSIIVQVLAFTALALALIRFFQLILKPYTTKSDIEKFITQQNSLLKVQNNMHWTYEKSSVFQAVQYGVTLHLDYKKINSNDEGKQSIFKFKQEKNKGLCPNRQYQNNQAIHQEYDSSITENRISEIEFKTFCENVNKKSKDTRKEIERTLIRDMIITSLFFYSILILSIVYDLSTFYVYLGVIIGGTVLFYRKIQIIKFYQGLLPTMQQYVDQLNEENFIRKGIKFFISCDPFYIEMILYYNYYEMEDEFYVNTEQNNPIEEGRDFLNKPLIQSESEGIIVISNSNESENIFQ